MRSEPRMYSALVLCLAAFAACGGDKTVTNKALGNQITVPDSWVFVDAELPYVAISARKMCLAMQVMDLKEGESLRSFFSDANNRKWLKGYRLIDIRMVQFGGVSGFKLIVEEATWQVAIYYAVAGGRGYAIWTAADNAEFVKHAEEFDAIVKSFKLIEAK